ncbi:MAG: hypothetical protein M3245_02690 [Actinomycetota bacterium]|nr:hypothetical protein [Actinomycetota bacterium]
MRRALLWIPAIVALAVPLHAGAATKTVQVRDNEFGPATTTVRVGDTVEWTWTGSNPHSVKQTNDVFPKSPITSKPYTYTRVFSSGNFPFVCEVHAGMTGTIRVPATISAAPSGLPFTVRWATTSTNTGTSWDVQYRIGSGAWTTWRSGTTSKSGVFGKDGKPVTVKSGKKYTFRARSKRSGKNSRWSPPRSITP